MNIRLDNYGEYILIRQKKSFIVSSLQKPIKKGDVRFIL